MAATKSMWYMSCNFHELNLQEISIIVILQYLFTVFIAKFQPRYF